MVTNQKVSIPFESTYVCISVVKADVRSVYVMESCSDHGLLIEMSFELVLSRQGKSGQVSSLCLNLVNG